MLFLSKFIILPLSSVFFTVNCLYEICKHSETTFKLIKSMLTVLPVLQVISCFFLFDKEDFFYEENASFFFLTIGINFSLVVSKLIVSTMAKVSSFYIRCILVSFNLSHFYFTFTGLANILTFLFPLAQDFG